MDLTTLAMIKKFMNEKPAGNAGPQPTGTIEITENGTGIDIAQYATANVNVTGDGGGNITLGPSQFSPTFVDTIPVVGNMPSLIQGSTIPVGYGLNAQNLLGLYSWFGSSPEFLIPSGLYIAFLGVDFPVGAYICGINDSGIYTSVVPWNGQIDSEFNFSNISLDSELNIGEGFGFTMPLINEEISFDDTSNMNYLIFVLSENNPITDPETDPGTSLS